MNEIDGLIFYNMVLNGYHNLVLNESNVNMLNVFPVPDGDTGTNMRLTLEMGLSQSKDIKDISLFSKALSRGMLIGARGNSGVILSQLFKGISNGLKGYEKADVVTFAKSLISSYENAYEKIKSPKEGTILTVAKEGLSRLVSRIDNNISFEQLLELVIEGMKKTLDKTPEILPVLKDNGVIDSGGCGLVIIYEGMLKYLNGEIIPYVEKDVIKVTNTKFNNILNTFKKEGVVKEKNKNVSFIAVSTNSFFDEAFTNFGIDVILDGNLNVSVKEFDDAIKSLNSKHIVILPNDKNSLLSCQMAEEINIEKDIYIHPTKNPLEGYYSLFMFDPSSEDLDMQDVVSKMKQSTNNLTTILYSKSIKESKMNDVIIHKDDYIAIKDGEIVCADKNLEKTILDSLNKIDDVSIYESFGLFKDNNLDIDTDSLFEDFIDNNDLELYEFEMDDKDYILMICLS
ncbi:MAG: DAK2 domain-containing protein [Acholeplasmatales bacterium]|nr:DAK2 domain-containing protein [Acholeplasmatales bacterium]